MKYYLDITLLPDAEAKIGFLWQKVYQQVHLALVENKIAENQSAIAVSFPKYGDKFFPLGDKLRLFSETQQQLEQLNMGHWLNRLTDYTHCTSIKEVPLSVNQSACFKRKQFKSNLLREAARRAKYKNESIEQAMAHFQSYKKECTLPFIAIESLSTNEVSADRRIFNIFIEHQLSDKASVGEFNCYGLSHRDLNKVATVPWF